MGRYGRLVKTYLPRRLAEAFDRAVQRDGRSASEILRSMVVRFARKDLRPARGTAHGPAHGPAA